MVLVMTVYSTCTFANDDYFSNNIDEVRAAFAANPGLIDTRETDYGYTPLMNSIRRLNYDISEFLINQGANVNLRDDSHMTALDWAIDRSYENTQEHVKLVELLINRGAIHSEYDPLCHSARQGGLIVFQFLIGKGGNANVKCDNNDTLLHRVADADWFSDLATLNGIEIAKLLINEHNIDIDARNDRGETALDIARRVGYQEMVTYLESVINQREQMEQQRIQQAQIAEANRLRLSELLEKIRNLDTEIKRIKDKYVDQTANVWRNADGDFNTARLTSNAVAGVALGALGGIIVNRIVKNRQLNQGFEDIKCNVASNAVSDFGDDFVLTGARSKEECNANSRSMDFVWAAKAGANGAEYYMLTENVNSPSNNACWARVEITSSDPRVILTGIRPRYFMVDQNINCGDWVNKSDLEKQILDQRRRGRNWATVGGAVGGAAVGVGAMELFGNSMIGGAVQGQAALNPEQLLHLRMTPDERIEYQKAIDELRAACNELQQIGGASELCK